MEVHRYWVLAVAALLFLGCSNGEDKPLANSATGSDSQNLDSATDSTPTNFSTDSTPYPTDSDSVLGGDTDPTKDTDSINTSELEDIGNGISVLNTAPPIKVTGTGTLAETTKALSWEAVFHSTVLDSIVVIPKDAMALLPALVIGDIISLADLGFLRKVVGVVDRGTDMEIQTVDATLAEAFVEGDFSFKVGDAPVEKSIAQSGFQTKALPGSAASWLQADLTNTTLYETEDENFKLSLSKGTIIATPDFDFNLSFSLNKVHLAEVLSTGNVKVEMVLKAEGEYDGRVDKTIEIPLF